MEMNLHRPVLTTAQKRNTTPNLSPSNGLDGHRKKSVGGDNHKSYKVYLDAIVNEWNGQPEELFKRKNWVHWIRTEANRRNSPDRYLSKKELNSFASALMDMMFAENEPHFDHLRNKFNKSQLERFQKLKKEYDEKEHKKLLEKLNSLDSESGEGSSDDENVVKSGVEVVGEVKSSVTAKPIEIHPNLSKQPFTNPFDSMLGMAMTSINKRPSVKPKNPKRTVEDRNKDIDMNRKRQRRLPELDGYKKLSIRRIPKSRVAPENFYSKTGSSTNSKHPRDGDRLDENGIKDILNESFNEGKEEVDIFENSTPPYSPMDVSNYSQPLDCTTTQISHLDTRRKVSNSGKPVNSTNTTSNQNYQRKISPTIDKCFARMSKSEKENSPRENQKIFANFSKPQVRNEPFTSSNNTLEVLHDEVVEDLPDIFAEEKENFPVTDEEILLKFPKPPSAPALTLEMFEEIKKPFDKPAKEKVVSGFGFNILQEDIIIISKETEWLIDLNIDFYLELIKERSKEEAYPSVYIFHSFFYTLLTEKEFGYSAVEDTTGEDDILQFDLLLIPVNLYQHWRLIVVKVQEKAIECYDSMAHSNQQILDSIEGFLLRWEKLRFKRDKKEKTDSVEKDEVEHDSDASTISPIPITQEGADTADVDDLQNIIEACSSPWTKHNKHSASIPQQDNAIDCGVFVLQYAEYLSRQQSFDFNQSHIPYFRKRMMYETLTKTLLTSN